MSMTLQEAKHLLSNAMKVKRELEEENAKLRELVREMRGSLTSGADEYFRKRAKELGIELER